MALKGKQQTLEHIQKRMESKKGYKHSDESKKKISIANFKRFSDINERIKLSKAHKGKKLSDETKKKITKYHKNNPVKFWLGKKRPLFSKETRKKMSETRKGIKLSEETKRKIGLAGKGRIAWNKGKILPQFSGENNSNWKGGISQNPYPKEFNFELKLKIRKRDNFTCCLCRKTEREELEELNRILCVNHIDFDKNNCNENNLNTLCLRCNVKINRERDYWTNYFNNK